MNTYNNEFENEKLQHWLMLNEPQDNMLYKKNWWKHHVYIRDIIIPLFYYEQASKESTEWKDIISYMSNQYDIIGTHTSKSIILPVMLMKYKGVEIVFRYNFHNYEVTVISDYDIKLPKGLFESANNTNFYYEGFPGKYKIHTPYTKSKKQFSVSIRHNQDYNFYTFMFLLKHEIDGRHKGLK